MTQEKSAPKVRLTALGVFVGIVPAFPGKHWLVVQFRRNGQWSSAMKCDTRDEAKKQRKKTFALHKKIFAERQAKRRKP